MLTAFLKKTFFNCFFSAQMTKFTNSYVLNQWKLPLTSGDGKRQSLLLVQKTNSLPLVKLLIFLPDNSILTSHGLRTSVFHIDWTSVDVKRQWVYDTSVGITKHQLHYHIITYGCCFCIFLDRGLNVKLNVKSISTR